MPETKRPLGLFEAYGIELEYMIVGRDTLDVLPVSDQLIKSVAGEYINEVEQGPVAWSNEVVLHVIEMKSNGPVPSLSVLPGQFQTSINSINAILDNMDGRLLPTAMHPWMNPFLHTRLWPHGNSEIYDTYNRIFNCEGHGWSNLQSMHINLPFADDVEFATLHSAIRLILPVLPAIAASSPIMEGELTGMMDTRLETYRRNAEIIPSITGLVVPEPVTSQAEYERVILQPMYRDIAPYDPDGILQEEWLNSRGAIAKFERNALEIRVLDVQETPVADLAIASLIVAVLKKLTANEWADQPEQLTISTEALAAIFTDTIRFAERTVIDNRDFLRLFRYPEQRCEAREFWQYLYESVASGLEQGYAGRDQALRLILESGPLARRIAKPLLKGYRRSKLHEIYRVLSECLAQGQLFEGID
jgi:glutamate---cysteine ligase / carboxylate-amine ligase